MTELQDQNDKKLRIASFRFGLIAEFVTGVRLHYGEKERLLNEKAAREYDIPFSIRNHVSRSSLEKWILDYKKAGYRIEGLYPSERSDKGKTRALSDSIKIAIKELKKDSPELKGPAVINLLKHKKLIAPDERINSSTLYSILIMDPVLKQFI